MILFLLLCFCFTPLHDVKVSLCNIVYDEKDKSLLIDFRLFTDDLQEAIKKPLLNNPLDKQFDADIIRYIETHFQFSVNQKTVKWYFFSRQANEEVFEIMFIVPGINQLEQLDIRNSILIAQFEKQQNIVKISAYREENNYILNRQTQTAKMTFP